MIDGKTIYLFLEFFGGYKVCFSYCSCLDVVIFNLIPFSFVLVGRTIWNKVD